MNFNLKFIQPLYILGVLFGAAPPLNFTTLHPKTPTYRLIYSLFLVILYLVVYAASIWKRFNDVYPSTPNITDAILDFASYTTITLTALVIINNNCLQYHKDIQRLFEKFHKVDLLLKANICSDNVENAKITAQGHAKWFRYHVPLLAFILLFNLFYSEIFWTVTITFEDNWGYTSSTIVKMQLFIASMLIYNMALALRYRFDLVNKSLKDFHLKIAKCKDVFVLGNNYKELNRINKINYIHKALLSMCIDFGQIFGTPILFLSASFIVSILHPINSALCQVMKGNVFDGVDIPNFSLHYVIISASSAFNSGVLVVPLAHASYAVVNESRMAVRHAENLAKDLSIFEYNDDVHEIIVRLRAFANESCKNYPIFTAACFYKVDHTMLFTLFGSVSSYLIVLIQINMFSGVKHSETNATQSTALN